MVLTPTGFAARGLDSLAQKLPRRLFEANGPQHFMQGIPGWSTVLATECNARAVQLGLNRHGFTPAYDAPNVSALLHGTETYEAGPGLRSDDHLSGPATIELRKAMAWRRAF